jgi:hypothetical protein
MSADADRREQEESATTSTPFADEDRHAQTPADAK